MMPTTREFLGDSLIKELEGAGFSPQSINAFAKNEYRQRKAAQEEEQRRLLYRADDMKLDGKIREALLSGDINEQEAKNAQKFEEFGSKKHGWALGAAKTVTGIANTVERVGDFINPFYEGKRDKDGNYIYQNGLEKSLRPKIKNVEKMRDDYEKATGETSWGSRLSEIGTELVGDPINFLGGVGLLSKGSKLAQFGKKTLYFAGTGAASGGVSALGEGKNDEETLKNIGAGAVGGAFLGHAIDQGIQGISKLIAKRQASRVANEVNAIDSAQNSEFLDGSSQDHRTTVATEGKLSNDRSGRADEATNTVPLARGGVLQGGAGGEASARKDGLSSSAEIMTAKEFATKEVGLDEDTATNVLKEAMQGKEKSEFIDADSYNDIVKFKNFETQREYAKAYGEKIQTAQTSINNAREQSAIRYADTQKAIGEYQKQGMSASATRELINAKFKPSVDEIDYTRAYNDGADVDARLTGQGIFYALEKDIAAQAYTPEIYATRLKQMGFSDESVQAFTQAYASKDIDIAKEYVNKKVADAYESRVQREVANEINAENRISINKNGAYSEHPMLRPDEPSIGQGDLKNDYAQIVKNIASDRNIALRLDPSADVLAIVKDFSKPIKTPIFTSKISVDKMLNHLADKADGERRLEYINLVKPTLENPLFITQETINGAQRFRFFKTFIDEKDKVVKFLNVVEDKNGELLEITATPIKNTDLKNLLKGKIVWGGDALSDLSSPRTAKRGSEANATIISQKGNLINEKAKNSALPNGVSSIGDNASGAGGRQGGDEEILRQSGRNTADASEEKWTAKSDRQMEQRPAFKGDGDTDATAASKQMVEKQGRDDNEIRGDGFVVKNGGKLTFMDEAKFELSKELQSKSDLGEKISTSLAWLHSKHPEMFENKRAVKELIDYVLDEPNTIKAGKSENSVYLGKKDDTKIKDIVVDKDSNKIIHANRRRMSSDEIKADGKDAHIPLHTDTMPAGATGANARSSADESIIPQKEINAKTINANSHIASGLVGGTLNSIDEDGSFNPEKFAAGFIAGLAGSKAVAIAARKMTPQLYNKILGTAKKMPQMAKDNPKLLGKLYANGKDVSLNSFAGEKAITANVGKLDQAKAMLEKGADEVEIWQKTGWFKDKDGAWKFEIGDSKARLNPNFKSGGRLSELLEHEELFKAYPELKDISVKKISDDIPKEVSLSTKDAVQREKRGIYNVAYNNKKSTIIRKDLETIDEIIKFEKGEADYVVNGERKNGYGALHIQKHLDTKNNGWVTKQEYLNMGQMLRKSTMQEADDKRIYTYFNDEGIRFRLVIGASKNKERVISFYSNRKPLKAGLSYNSQNYDGNLPLNDDIIAQNGTKGYYSPANNEIGLSDLGDKSTLMHEVQHAIQEIEGFAKGSGAKGENYRLSHGEAEARNVQNRLNLGDKFRAKIVKDNNPVGDDYHAWIRGENDTKTFKQAYDDDGGGDLAPDFTEAMAKKLLIVVK